MVGFLPVSETGGVDPAAAAGYVLSDPIGILMLLCGAAIVLFTVLAGAYLGLGALGSLLSTT